MRGTRQSCNTAFFACLGLVGTLLVLLGSGRSLAIPPMDLPLAKAVEQADFVGVVKIADVPAAPKAGFRASAPPMVGAKPLSVLKGAALADLRIVWQTYSSGGCDLRDPETVEVVPPVVGGEYMVYLTKGKDGTFARLGYQWYFHMMPAAPNVRVQPWDKSWRGLIEVSPAVAGPGEAVRYRFTRTRLAAEPWIGEESNVTAEDIDVIDFTRKRVLQSKKPGARKSTPAIIAKGDTVVDAIDLTDAFGITQPGEYWVFRGGAFESQAPLRFEVTDKLRVRTDKD